MDRSRGAGRDLYPATETTTVLVIQGAIAPMHLTASEDTRTAESHRTPPISIQSRSAADAPNSDPLISKSYATTPDKTDSGAIELAIGRRYENSPFCGDARPPAVVTRTFS